MSDTLVSTPTAEDRKQPEKRKKRRGVAWWWLLVFLAIAALVYVPIWYAGLYDKKPAPPPQKAENALQHAAREKVENAFFFRIDGKDKLGRAAAFDFIILTDGYTWVKGSTSEVVSGDRVIPEAEVADHVLSPKVRNSLGSASDLIAVGLASQEGQRTQEEARAAARSQTVAGWIRQVVNPEIALWTLTLGQYDKACKHQEDADSSFERPVLFVGVRSKAEGANLQEALANAVGGHDNLPSRECYSRFDMEKIR